jgi:hypothetical protein
MCLLYGQWQQWPPVSGCWCLVPRDVALIVGIWSLVQEPASGRPCAARGAGAAKLKEEQNEILRIVAGAGAGQEGIEGDRVPTTRSHLAHLATRSPLGDVAPVAGARISAEAL